MKGDSGQMCKKPRPCDCPVPKGDGKEKAEALGWKNVSETNRPAFSGMLTLMQRLQCGTFTEGCSSC